MPTLMQMVLALSIRIYIFCANANSQNLQFTTPRTKSSQSAVPSPVVTWYGFQCCSFLSFRFHVHTGRWLSHNELNSRLIPFKTTRYGLHRKHWFQQFSYCCVSQLLHGPHRDYYFAVSPLVCVRKLLPSNGRCLHCQYLAMGLRATVCNV
jgi:hypothetical protein